MVSVSLSTRRVVFSASAAEGRAPRLHHGTAAARAAVELNPAPPHAATNQVALAFAIMMHSKPACRLSRHMHWQHVIIAARRDLVRCGGQGGISQRGEQLLGLRAGA